MAREGEEEEEAESLKERKKRQIHLQNAHRPVSALFSTLYFPLQPPHGATSTESCGGFFENALGRITLIRFGLQILPFPTVPSL